jgi:hypothetical protein
MVKTSWILFLADFGLKSQLSKSEKGNSCHFVGEGEGGSLVQVLLPI